MNEDKDIKMPNFLVDTSLKDCVNILSDTRAGKLFKLLFEYAENQEIDESQLDSATRLAFSAFKPGIDKGRKKYFSVVNRNRENGKKGGRPKKTQNNPNNPMGISKTQNNPKKQIKLNKSKLISKDINLRLSASYAGSPDGRPAPKPEYCELRKFFKEVSGYDDAYFCDEFFNKMEDNSVDWQNWQDKMINYAVKAGKLSYE